MTEKHAKIILDANYNNYQIIWTYLTKPPWLYLMGRGYSPDYMSVKYAPSNYWGKYEILKLTESSRVTNWNKWKKQNKKTKNKNKNKKQKKTANRLMLKSEDLRTLFSTNAVDTTTIYWKMSQ